MVFTPGKHKRSNGMPSSVVAFMKYIPERSVLRVTYVSGMVYDYLNVPSTVYDEMRAATSKGKFLNERIKGNYPFKKVSKD
ncbi:KTSC domain-containing protein [Pedobacter immunditicola]|uniref:KTSC domain-containing protein n=1 Tax=Pedobacter immunditicola TaxID=3133440 RepID=UPI0030AC77B7